ncbi:MULTISPECIES: universal stress protein [Cyanophyceae]|uniref:Universal stress protein n=1 Tax=Nodularia spumigena CENA596 TaxID=1819295 RepID=A0A166ILV6_NODSP|nr:MULTISPECIES: universal stress protein [Cyanophyceae]MDB9355475.1 universal stress protein [Nodularia spumigena CS-587/03]KZL48562.1 universal stress protein [Nodularia spumigena CENA596]MDB9316960.1 universal stress protein [Nodularia spumigena CS-590/01A]MDB9321857.1 universal stress protein [Nodularia spumigena CS-591/07A]MDB9325318.1 universal stress protein [Nodularia spumigena CS-590/02]
MKTILLCTDGSSFAENVYRYGAWFALQFHAQINVLFVTDIRSQKVVSTGNLSGSLGLGADEELLHELVELEHKKAKLNNQRARLILQNASETLKAEGIADFKLTNKTGFLVDCFHEFEKDADLIVLGQRGEAADFASGHLGANVDRIVRSSSKTCLVIPREFKPIERILVTYDGSVTGKKILQFLVNYPSFPSLEIHVLTVAKSNTVQTAMDKLNEAKQGLEKAGFEPICSVIEGESEKVIGNYVNQQDISLLLMGAYGYSRIRNLVIGSTTAQLLRSSNIPVLLFR